MLRFDFLFFFSFRRCKDVHRVFEFDLDDYERSHYSFPQMYVFTFTQKSNR